MKAEVVTERGTGQSIPGQDRPLAQGTARTKVCPFCAEPIQEEAIKCRYCGEFLDGSGRSASTPRVEKWYYDTRKVVIALLLLGPLALPFVWLNPRYKLVTKVIVTVVVSAITVWGVYQVFASYQRVLDQIRALGV